MLDRPQPVSACCAMSQPDAGRGQSRSGTTREPGYRTDRRGARPRILLELQNRLDAYLDDPGRHLPTLKAVNGSDRQQRHERRVACVQLSRAMLSYLEINREAWTPVYPGGTATDFSGGGWWRTNSRIQTRKQGAFAAARARSRRRPATGRCRAASRPARRSPDR